MRQVDEIRVGQRAQSSKYVEVQFTQRASAHQCRVMPTKVATYCKCFAQTLVQQHIVHIMYTREHRNVPQEELLERTRGARGRVLCCGHIGERVRRGSCVRLVRLHRRTAALGKDGAGRWQKLKAAPRLRRRRRSARAGRCGRLCFALVASGSRLVDSRVGNAEAGEQVGDLCVRHLFARASHCIRIASVSGNW